MLWQPSIVDRGLKVLSGDCSVQDWNVSILEQQKSNNYSRYQNLLHRGFVRLVVQPPKPCGRNHGSVIIYTMLGIVDNPSVMKQIWLHLDLYIYLCLFLYLFTCPCPWSRQGCGSICCHTHLYPHVSRSGKQKIIILGNKSGLMEWIKLPPLMLENHNFDQIAKPWGRRSSRDDRGQLLLHRGPENDILYSVNIIFDHFQSKWWR